MKLLIPGDMLPATARRDVAQANLEWRGTEWKVVSVHGTDAPEAPFTPSAMLGEDAPVEFVLSDIDSDADFDIIVLDGLANTEKSVWRNDGAGRFDKLPQKLYGKHRFPNGQYHRRNPLPCSGACTATGWRPTDSTVTAIREWELVTLGFDGPAANESLAALSYLSDKSGRSPPVRV
ncbi:MAG: hypothetical protein U5J83_12530 [Bryobacterales bacterium]|nr:hypothetical protein [Bryobacterales bacterium]